MRAWSLAGGIEIPPAAEGVEGAKTVRSAKLTVQLS